MSSTVSWMPWTPTRGMEKAREIFDTEGPTDEQMKEG
jgi:hypothetical protein